MSGRRETSLTDGDGGAPFDVRREDGRLAAERRTHATARLTLGGGAWYRLVDVELIPFGIGHCDSVMIQTLRDDRAQPRGTERNEPRRLSLDPLAPGVERRTATTARVHVDVDAVLDRLLLGDDLEPDARTLTVRILDDVRATAKFVFRHTNRPEEVVPRVEAGRRRCDHVVQRLGPETSERFG